MTFGITGLFRHVANRLFRPGVLARRKYEAFKALLDGDHVCHTQLAKIEQIYHEDKHVDFNAVAAAYDVMVESLYQMAENLETMAPFSYRNLSRLLADLDGRIRVDLAVENPDCNIPFIADLSGIFSSDQRFAGAKAVNLSRLSNELNLPVPKGFVITSSAFNTFCRLNGIQKEIGSLLARLDIESASGLEETSEAIIALFRSTPLPIDLADAITAAYDRLLPGCLCAVRSSGVGEDTVVSFAGQYKTVLDVSRDGIAGAYREVLASKYTPAALSYRIRHGFLEDETPMAVLVLEMVATRSSGVMYTRDPLGTRKNMIQIYSIPGRGDALVQGEVSPDVAEINGENGIQVVTAGGGSLDLGSAARLGDAGFAIDSHFDSAQDVEWCLGKDGAFYFLQSRPLGVSSPERNTFEIAAPDISNRVLLSGGEKAASGVSMGRVAVITSPADLKHLPYGAVLVARTTSPQFAQVAGKLKAVVTDIGSVAGHFASVAREWGIPTLVNTRSATEVLKPGQIVTVDADRRRVLEGVAETLLAFNLEQEKLPVRNPFKIRLRKILDRVSPLNLIDPASDFFTAANCKTLHDWLRFVHEKAIQEMFVISGRGKRRFRGARKLKSDTPVILYLLDIGDGISVSAGKKSDLVAEHILCRPFTALWKGLSGFKEAWLPDVIHFDWWNFDRLSLGGGIVNFDSQLFSSFVLVTSDYFNANIRFGLHFSVIDALITPSFQDNYVSLRFEGGGADFEGKHLRAIFLARVLENHGFQVNLEKDSVTAVFERADSQIVEEKLEILGRLLAFTPYLDMTLKDLSEVNNLVNLFSQKSAAHVDDSCTGSSIADSKGTISPRTDESTLAYRPTWITDQLAVGHAPMSYEELNALKTLRINAIVNLCAEYPELYQIEKDDGFDVCYLPVPDDQAPELQEMDKALSWLDETMYLGKKVIIHCRLGVGRTGTFLRSYFIRRGFDSGEIENRLKRIHSHPTSSSQWRLLKTYKKQSKNLTIREPSLEVERIVDLGSIFAEYEALCRLAGSHLTGGCQPASHLLQDADKLAGECCAKPFVLHFMEAVYLRHYLIQKLGRSDRIRVTEHAVALNRKAKEDKKYSGVSEHTAAGDEYFNIGDSGVDLSWYRCPLNISGKCVLHFHRPIRCRVFDVQENQYHRELEELSKELFFILNGRFLEGRNLIFPITDVISGKYIEKYFFLLSELTLHGSLPEQLEDL